MEKIYKPERYVFSTLSSLTPFCVLQDRGSFQVKMVQENSKKSDRFQNNGKENQSEVELKNKVKTDTGNGKKGTSDKERYIIRGKKTQKIIL